MDNSENIIRIRKQKICSYLWNNYYNNITLHMLAEVIHVSERTCERAIHDHLHTRLKNLVNAIRFYKTIDHYKKHQENIFKSAIANGFTDRRNFQRWWNKWMNIPLDHAQVDIDSILRNMKSEYTEFITMIKSYIPENYR
jgi:AraC-like DNA-binding protein